MDGKYSLEATPGRKRVEVTAMRDVPGKFSEANPGEKVPVREQYIPKKFNADSKLEFEVKAGPAITNGDFSLAP